MAELQAGALKKKRKPDARWLASYGNFAHRPETIAGYRGRLIL